MHPNRTLPSHGFTRYIGYDSPQEFQQIIMDLYQKSMESGVFIQDRIENPTNEEVSTISREIDINHFSDIGSILKSVDILSQKGLIKNSNIAEGISAQEISEQILNILDIVKKEATSVSMVKNTYIKIILWLSRFSQKPLKNVLYIGEINKYEVIALYLFSNLGCDVNYVNYLSADSYNKADTKLRFSRLVEGKIHNHLNIDFGKINFEQIALVKSIKDEVENKPVAKVRIFEVLAENFERDVLQTLEGRRAKLGLNICTVDNEPTISVAYVGINDEDNYNNTLFSIKNEYEVSGRKLIFTSKLANPTFDESKEYQAIDKSTTDSIIFTLAGKIDCGERTKLVRRAYVDCLNKIENKLKIQAVYSKAVILLVWINRYFSREFFAGSDLPVILFYGKPSETELLFLRICIHSMIDTLVICSDKGYLPNLEKIKSEGIMQVIELPNSATSFPFPSAMRKARVSTVAYNAEKELDSIMYNDDYFFRCFQFANCRAVTLQTTFEEIDIIWEQESKYRTGFEVKNNLVSVPNIFAKICGVKNGDQSEYVKEICYKITEDTIVFNRIPFCPIITSRLDFSKFIDGSNILIEDLKKSPVNKYSYLNDDKQNFLFYKLQELIDCGYIDIPIELLPQKVLHTCFNMDKDIIKLVQKFDFTKSLPKVIVFDCVEKTFGESDCILLMLLNLMGFDILIYTPTGYKNIETFVNPKAFTSYTLDTFVHDMRLPRLKPLKRPTGGLFGRLFK